jgi:predicted nucleic acid-binding protein
MKIVVPDVVVGEAFTKLRYDRRVSPRRDANVALSVFRLVDETADLFELRPAGPGSYRQARDILTQSIDQSFSFVDAIIFTIVNDDPAVSQILTVDGRDFSTYRFAHAVEIVVP